MQKWRYTPQANMEEINELKAELLHNWRAIADWSQKSVEKCDCGADRWICRTWRTLLRLRCRSDATSRCRTPFLKREIIIEIFSRFPYCFLLWSLNTLSTWQGICNLPCCRTISFPQQVFLTPTLRWYSLPSPVMTRYVPRTFVLVPNT